VTTWGRTTALILLACPLLVGAVLAGCAHPGQLGHPLPSPEPAPPAAPAAPPAPQLPALLGSGRVEGSVSMRSPGPAVYAVRTETLAPGASTGWHRHPGTELTIVKSGSIRVQWADRCEGTRYAAGDAVFVGDKQPHKISNDGDVPAELLVTYLLDPTKPDKADVPDPC
jgi:quercetin dioxygenase-like cupin family protein